MSELYQNDPGLSTEFDSRGSAYYAIIPAPVRYHTELSANAKLLYGEISALCGREGFCWANNAYFSQLYTVTERSVIRMIRSLEEYGFISTIVERDPKSGQVKGRKIYLKESTPDEHPHDKIVRSKRQNCQDPPDKNVTHLYSNNNIYINRANSCKSFSASGQFATWVQSQADAWPEAATTNLLEAFGGFLDSRTAAKKPIKSQRAVTLLCNRLQNLSGGDPVVMAKLLDEAVVRGWQSVYPLDSKVSRVASAPQGRDKEWL